MYGIFRTSQPSPFNSAGWRPHVRKNQREEKQPRKKVCFEFDSPPPDRDADRTPADGSAQVTRRNAASARLGPSPPAASSACRARTRWADRFTPAGGSVFTHESFENAFEFWIFADQILRLAQFIILHRHFTKLHRTRQTLLRFPELLLAGFLESDRVCMHVSSEFDFRPSRGRSR